MTVNKKNLLFTSFLICCLIAKADVRLPAFVGDNMVLERNAKISLWGWADTGEKIDILFQNQHLKATTGKDGKWTVVLQPVPAGGPFEMSIKGNNTINIKNILIGDVWLASGQSNMEMALRNINNAKAEIDSANYPQIRLFYVAKEAAFKPQTVIVSDGGWKECNAQTVENFSAIAYLFGRQLYEKYKVPIGLIEAAWGGTPAEAWTSTEALKTLPFMKERIAAVSNFSEKDSLDYALYAKRLATWKKNFQNIDRGYISNSSSWADTNLNTSDWQIMKQPLLWSDYPSMKENVPALKGYSGTVWFRKDIDIPQEQAGKSVELNLGLIAMSDTTFFNGEVVGVTPPGMGLQTARVYKVPACLIHAGRNVITIKIAGIDGLTGGIVGPDMFMQLANGKISLLGDWLFKPGPDLSTYPESVALTKLVSGMPNTPSVNYNGMIAPLIPYTVKGVIWYQGENNATTQEQAEQYRTLFPTLIQDWRSRWGYDFPFLFVQLAGYQPNKPEPADYAWSTLREAQEMTLTLPNTGMATAIDIGEESDVHPKNKKDVAYRLFLAAKKVAYGEDIVYSGPSFNSAKITDNKIRISFDNTGSGLLVKDKYGYVRGFAIAGADKKFVWAKAWQEGNEIVVMSDEIKNPAFVRYDWENTPDGNVYNKEGLPATPFRTDQ